MIANRYGRRALSTRQMEIIALVAEALSHGDIGEKLGITGGYVKLAVQRIYDKLGFHNRVELALWYVAHRGTDGHDGDDQGLAALDELLEEE